MNGMCLGPTGLVAQSVLEQMEILPEVLEAEQHSISVVTILQKLGRDKTNNIIPH
jgi:hypothetical protein